MIASEVKELAGEAKAATQDIEEMVTEAQSRTRETVSEVETATSSIEEGATTAENTLTALRDTVDYIDTANQGIQEISSTVDAQAEANQRVVDQVHQVAELGEDVDEQAEGVSTVAQSQISSVTEISQRASTLRGDLSGLEESLTPFVINDWRERIVDHCREAGIDWRQFEGTTLTIGTSEHPFTSTTEPLLPSFEELTGIDIEYVTLPEEQLLAQLEQDMDSGQGRFDAFYLGLWACAKYHQRGWVQNLHPFLEDASMTDKRWFQLDDFPNSAFEAFTYGNNDLVGMPFGIEPFGCVAYDEPTFQLLGLEEPTDFEGLQHCAKTIHESDQIDRAGICARTNPDALSTPNWVTMFKSHGAAWIDRRERTATVTSPATIQSLETYATLVSDYGPGNVRGIDWVDLNSRFFENGEFGMIYHGPASVMATGGEQYTRTKWLPPLAGPNGDRSAGVYAWGLGISQHSENPGAAWLYLQWATCRQMDLVTSTSQWDGQDEYIPARGNWTLDQPEYETRGHVRSWIDAFTEGIELVPADVPPVPLDTPRNMEIMSEAATAMGDAATGTKSAERALNDIAPTISKHVQQIPDEYLRGVTPSRQAGPFRSPVFLIRPPQWYCWCCLG